MDEILALCRVSAVLRDVPGLMSCLTCLAIDAHVPRTIAAEAAQHLAGPGGFRLTNGVCGRCGASQVVLYFNEWARATVEVGRAA
jgi:hypothetical protein